MKTIVTLIQADDLDYLQSKSLGYNHDRCHTLFFGKTKYCPVDLKDLHKPTKEWCAIYEEPVIPTLNVESKTKE